MLPRQDLSRLHVNLMQAVAAMSMAGVDHDDALFDLPTRHGTVPGRTRTVGLRGCGVALRETAQVQLARCLWRVFQPSGVTVFAM
jgi:hypothetical protein